MSQQLSRSKDLVRLATQKLQPIRRIRALNVQLADRHRQNSTQLHHHQLLANARSGAEIEGSERILVDVQGLAFACESSLWKELACTWPEFVEAVRDEDRAHEHEACGWVALACLWVREEEAFLALSDAPKWIVET